MTVFGKSIEPHTKNKIKDFIKGYTRLTEDRVSINYGEIPEAITKQTKSDDFIAKINSYTEKVFYPIDLSQRKYNCMPPALELRIDARPKGLVRSWKCGIETRDIKELIDSGTTLPANFFFNLRKYESRLMKSDSLIVSVSALDTLSGKHESKQISFSFIRRTIQRIKEPGQKHF